MRCAGDCPGGWLTPDRWGAAFAAPPAAIVRPDGRRDVAAGDLNTFLSGSCLRFDQACHPSPSRTPEWTRAVTSPRKITDSWGMVHPVRHLRSIRLLKQ